MRNSIDYCIMVLQKLSERWASARASVVVGADIHRSLSDETALRYRKYADYGDRDAIAVSVRIPRSEQ
jgi:hypothetical protein